MSTALQKIDFYGDTVWAGRDPEDCEGHLHNTGPHLHDAGGAGAVLVAVKPIVERLGVDWKGQLERIKRNEIMAKGIRMTRIPSAGGEQETVCLPLNLIPGFLFGIDTSRISDPDKRKAVLAYQEHCYEVLYRHFFGPAEKPADPTVDATLYEINTKMRMIEAATKLNGKAAGRALWAELGLPPLVGEPAAPPQRGSSAEWGTDFVRQFLDERTADAPGGRVQASELFKAWQAWRDKTGAPHMTQTAFGLTCGRLGLRKSIGRVYTYLGIRILHISEFAEGIERGDGR